MIVKGDLYLSQSMTKELGIFVIDDLVEEVDYCPKRFASKYIHKDYPDEPSLNMLQGSYAEGLILGSSARGQIVNDLPRKKNGDKTVAHKRIDIQANRLYGYMYARGVRLNEFNTQVRLTARYSKHIWLTGELDVFPVLVDGDMSIVDVKTTKNIYSNFFSINEKWIRSSCHHCWGDFSKIAKNQPLFYHFLARNFKKTGLDELIRLNPSQADKYRYLFSVQSDFNVRFHYMVAGIGTPDIDSQLTSYEYNYVPQLLDLVIFSASNKIRESLRDNFKAKPSEALCKSCALKDLCKDSVA